MGYNTDFKGVVLFKEELYGSQIAKLHKILGVDVRDHPEIFGIRSGSNRLREFYHVDLEFTDDFTGLMWNGNEKTTGMVEMLNFIISYMRGADPRLPKFGFYGKMLAQGEDMDDRYEIVIKNDRFVKNHVPHTGTKLKCPLCEGHFYLE